MEHHTLTDNEQMELEAWAYVNEPHLLCIMKTAKYTEYAYRRLTKLRMWKHEIPTHYGRERRKIPIVNESGIGLMFLHNSKSTISEHQKNWCLENHRALYRKRQNLEGGEQKYLIGIWLTSLYRFQATYFSLSSDGQFPYLDKLPLSKYYKIEKEEELFLREEQQKAKLQLQQLQQQCILNSTDIAIGTSNSTSPSGFNRRRMPEPTDQDTLVDPNSPPGNLKIRGFLEKLKSQTLDFDEKLDLSEYIVKDICQLVKKQKSISSYESRLDKLHREFYHTRNTDEYNNYDNDNDDEENNDQGDQRASSRVTTRSKNDAIIRLKTKVVECEDDIDKISNLAIKDLFKLVQECVKDVILDNIDDLVTTTSNPYPSPPNKNDLTSSSSYQEIQSTIESLKQTQDDVYAKITDQQNVKIVQEKVILDISRTFSLKNANLENEVSKLSLENKLLKHLTEQQGLMYKKLNDKVESLKRQLSVEGSLNHVIVADSNDHDDSIKVSSLGGDIRRQRPIPFVMPPSPLSSDDGDDDGGEENTDPAFKKRKRAITTKW